MNKKLIVLIGAIIIIAIVGILIFVFVGNNNENDNETNNNMNHENINSVNNNDNSDNTEESNILVLYFSMSGNTEAVANIIHDEVGGDIIKLETKEEYPKDYDELLDYAQEEQRDHARPELATTIDNIDDYDIIFLGYPIWWTDMPMPIYTFLDEYDLSGKTIAPFITHGGSGLSGTPATIREEEPNATVTEGLAIYGSRAQNSRDQIIDWLNNIEM